MELSAFGRRLMSDSGTRSLMDDLGDIASAGGGILNLGGGNPSLIPAAEAVFRRRMRELLERDRAFERAIGAYGGPDGHRGFARALAGFLQDELGWNLTERNIALTNGSQSAFVALFNLLAGPMPDGAPASRILLPLAPEYIGYADVGFAPGVLTARRSTVRELGDKLFKYGVDFDGLDEVEGIGAICLSRPGNPTGNVVTDAEVERLRAVARARGVPLILDNAYGLPFPGIVFGPATPVWDEQTIVCLSLSKLGLPAFRTGIVIASEAIVEALVAATAVFCLSPGGVGPALATELVASGEVPALVRDVIRPHYAERAARAVDRLRAGLDGYDVRIHKPEGAFFLWLWMRGLPVTNAALYERLKARGVIVVSGHYFFPGLEDDDWPHKRECIRISYADDWERIERGLDIIVDEVRRAYDDCSPGSAGR
ncbi:MAG: valine--pyruvate transaminase [Acidobacteria bacterium]|nr:valine--pyruvate transaminase [Acidobacteriota bacterium]